MGNIPKKSPNGWTLLVYRVPAQPTKLRLAVWRKLHQMGALYLQDAVCVLPERDDLTENLTYVASMIEEMGGSCHLFTATAVLPHSAEEIADGFRKMADQRLAEIIERLDAAQTSLEAADDFAVVERAEGELKRERVAYLRSRKLAYFGASPEREAEVDQYLEQLKAALDERYRSESK